MAFDQTTRNRLARFVSDARTLLTEEFTRQLQHEYGLDPASGEVTALEKLTALDDARRETAHILRETVDYYSAASHPSPAGRGAGVRDVLERILREQAFTVLNRLCALRMAEARGVILEAVGRGYRSKGFQLYARLAGGALGETGEAYRVYLFSLFDELAVELPPLFDRFSPQGRIFPRETALLKLLDLLNAPDLEALWAEDETIGWIYQYFNSQEERKAMRAASQAPRNSRELAVRNQFFTPRYVVEFLTDNTLGRTWYEMTRGGTALKDACRYLVRRPTEVFLGNPHLSPDYGVEWVQKVGASADFSLLPAQPSLREIGDLALLLDGYEIAPACGYGDVLEFGSRLVDGYLERGEPFPSDPLQLWLILFAYQRGYLRNSGSFEENDPYLQGVLDLYAALRQALQNPPQDLSQEELLRQPVFIPRRPLKDPREIKMLDPACGSMHFGLYAFDLYEVIYAEAWDWEEQHGSQSLWRMDNLEPLQQTYPDREAYLRAVPRLIIEHNIHGIDIDPRAVQIAGLSLWLRAQKSWQAQGVRPRDRPRIQKSNVVCAEPMPGDRAMLEEFLETIGVGRLEALMQAVLKLPAGQKVRTTQSMVEALTRLVRTVWQEMELAGEAGSLLKIDETLRVAIADARKSSAEKAPLFRMLEFGLESPTKDSETQQDFWDQAEALVLAALSEYAGQAETAAYRRRLFAGDAVQGFAFIDLCRKRYDVVVMNPPFGQATISVFPKLKTTYKDTYVDVYACFVARGLEVAPKGFVGAITSRAFEMTKKLARWRENQVVPSIQILLDLGLGVMDDAFVEAVAYTLSCSGNTDIIFAINRRFSNSKADPTFDNQELHVVHRDDIKSLPGQKLLYSLPQAYFRLLRDPLVFEPKIGTAREGLRTFDDFRFLRLRWEPYSHEIGENFTWESYAKGGEYSQYYSDIHLLVKWKQDGAELAEMNRNVNGQVAQARQASEYYRRPGATYSKRSAKGFSARTLPAGCIIGTKGPAILSESDVDPAYLVGWLNSNLIVNLIHIQANAFEFNTGIIKKLPWRFLPEQEELISLTYKTILAIRAFKSKEETNSLFISPVIRDTLQESGDQQKHLLAISQKIQSECQQQWNTSIEREYCISNLQNKLDLVLFEEDDEGTQEDSDDSHNDNELIDSPAPILSYCLGTTIGRWNIRFTLLTNVQYNPFTVLPVCPPGMLQNDQGLPAAPQDIPADYPLRISWPGILTDDDGHPEDIEGRVREALHVIWQERAESIEQEACQILGVRSLREYFRKPTLFFADHLKRYSKSRRQAPIYWPLSTPSGSYTLWLYYHRLSDQILFTCVNDFADPKLKQVSEDLARLQRKFGRSAADEKELERLADLERELKDFRTELLRVAAFWKPNLNDGVEITAAPLWRLFQHKPWQKRLKETWAKLEAGDYDWAHIAYSIWPERVKEKCKTDKSLAIAHGLEAVYVEPKGPAKKKKGRQAIETDELFDEE